MLEVVHRQLVPIEVSLDVRAAVVALGATPLGVVGKLEHARRQIITILRDGKEACVRLPTHQVAGDSVDADAPSPRFRAPAKPPTPASPDVDEAAAADGASAKSLSWADRELCFLSGFSGEGAAPISMPPPLPPSMPSTNGDGLLLPPPAAALPAVASSHLFRTRSLW